MDGRAEVFSCDVETEVFTTSIVDCAVGHSLLSNSRFVFTTLFVIFHPLGSLNRLKGVPIGA